MATTVEMARLSGNLQLLAGALATECQVAASRGDVDTAIRCGEEGVAVVAALGTPWISAPVGSRSAWRTSKPVIPSGAAGSY